MIFVCISHTGALFNVELARNQVRQRVSKSKCDELERVSPICCHGRLTTILRSVLAFCGGHGREYLLLTLKTYMGHGGCVRCESSVVQQALQYGGLQHQLYAAH